MGGQNVMRSHRCVQFLLGRWNQVFPRLPGAENFDNQFIRHMINHVRSTEVKDMISKLTMSNVASYKAAVSLETNKRINLIYGLNGSGKTVLSSFMYDPQNPDYSSCRIEGLNGEKILVYSERFIQDNFFEAENLKGIFTLSQENKIAEEAILKAKTVIKGLEDIVQKAKNDKDVNERARQRIQTEAENNVWEIKTTYTGGDRVLEFCLDNLKGRKESLFNHIISIPKPAVKPQSTVESLRKEVEVLQSQGDEEIDQLVLVDFQSTKIESDDSWQTILVGNENSAVAGLIERLNNSDWVKKGLSYLGPAEGSESAICPFCQQSTISASLRNDIKKYFDENYERALETIGSLKTSYEQLSESLPSLDSLLTNVFAKENRGEIELALGALVKIVENNQTMMAEKIRQPSQTISLTSTADAVEKLNASIRKVNEKVIEQNRKIKKKSETLSRIKTTFWQIMRFDYDQTLAKYRSDISEINNSDRELGLSIENSNREIAKKNGEIAQLQKSTINIDESVQNINSGLVELGIDSFSIVKYQEYFYRISRNGNLDHTFKTLSEGEKMIISFLYFRELCKGRSDAQETSTKKIVVIDDPISSLSHIYVFNVGRLIKNTFLRTDDYDQVFILTHSLYFFYEIVETDHEKRKLTHKLFRLAKNTGGSFLAEMRYEEIQSDYQAYWYIIRDLSQPPALIANSMRNILEYFFNFIEKRDLNNLFSKPELSSVRFQAFNRFVNRESHSLGQNIFDYKEFNYDDFRDAFEELFNIAGYREHYLKMMKK
jgi:wobble nucleotide-excising tRNase